jgi:hypothetical protein
VSLLKDDIADGGARVGVGGDQRGRGGIEEGLICRRRLGILEIEAKEKWDWR